MKEKQKGQQTLFSPDKCPVLWGICKRSATLNAETPVTQVEIWQWLKIKELGLRRFCSTFPLTRVPFWYRVLEPYPFGRKKDNHKKPRPRFSPQPLDQLRSFAPGLLRAFPPPAAERRQGAGQALARGLDQRTRGMRWLKNRPPPNNSVGAIF